MTKPVEASAWRPWIGRTEEAEDVVTAHAVRGLRAIFDDATPVAEGDALPPAWHWMFTQPAAPQSQLGLDGHPRRGGFLPPIELPRRMWAGSDVTFEAPIRVGDRIRRVSAIESLVPKSGSTGALVFVTVRHEMTSSSGGRSVDLQRIVYREEAVPGAPQPKAAPPGAGPEFSLTLEPDPVMLFRFSALTFNGHRIHYDLPYARDVEGYRGLVVHGPLLALAMLESLRRHRPEARVTGFSFTPRRPVTTPGAIRACGRRDGEAWDLWVESGGAAASVARAKTT